MFGPYFERGLNIWDPWREIRQLREEFDRMMNRRSSTSVNRPSEFPAVNIWSNEENIIVTAELPGVQVDDVNLTVHNDQLTVRGKRQCHECAENEVFHRRERGFGEFVRTIGLPFAVDSEKVDATFSNGILKITLPRAEADKPKQISIKS